MKLSIDIGNSRVKLAVFNDDKCVIVEVTNKENLINKRSEEHTSELQSH